LYTGSSDESPDHICTVFCYPDRVGSCYLSLLLLVNKAIIDTRQKMPNIAELYPKILGSKKPIQKKSDENNRGKMNAIEISIWSIKPCRAFLLILIFNPRLKFRVELLILIAYFYSTLFYKYCRDKIFFLDYINL